MEWLILGFISLQRLFELILARRNTERLLRNGAVEYFPEHYPLIVMLHLSWLVALAINMALSPEIAIHGIFLGLFVLLTVFRFWILMTLGPYFTTRIISSPSLPLIRTGPYQYMKHPNYVVVMGEIVCVPLIFGWWKLALIWGAMNAGLLWYRVRCENQALKFRQPA